MEADACGVCFERFDEAKHCPRTLFCGHTYCHTCLASLTKASSVTCPACQRSSSLPASGAPKNYQVRAR